MFYKNNSGAMFSRQGGEASILHYPSGRESECLGEPPLAQGISVVGLLLSVVCCMRLLLQLQGVETWHVS